MGPVDVNGGVHTAHKQHQRICIGICARASNVDWVLLSAFPLTWNSGMVISKDLLAILPSGWATVSKTITNGELKFLQELELVAMPNFHWKSTNWNRNFTQWYPTVPQLSYLQKHWHNFRRKTDEVSGICVCGSFPFLSLNISTKPNRRSNWPFLRLTFVAPLMMEYPEKRYTLLWEARTLIALTHA